MPPRISSPLPLIVLAGLVLGQVVGCGSNGDSTAPVSPYATPETGSGLGLLALQMEAYGAPGDSAGQGHQGGGHAEWTELSSVFLTIDSIRLYAACEDGDSTGWGHGNDGHGWNPCRDEDGMDDHRYGDDRDHRYHHEDGDYFEALIEPFTVDLMELGPTLNDLLATMELPEGHYNGLTLGVSEAWVITAAGERFPATLPHDEWTDLRVVVPFTVEEATVTELVLAVDLARAVVEAPPGSKNFILRPVLHGDFSHVGHHHGNGDGDGGHGDGDGEGEGNHHGGGGNGGGGHH